jgi:hypothetical protein
VLLRLLLPLLQRDQAVAFVVAVLLHQPLLLLTCQQGKPTGLRLPLVVLAVVLLALQALLLLLLLQRGSAGVDPLLAAAGLAASCYCCRCRCCCWCCGCCHCLVLLLPLLCLLLVAAGVVGPSPQLTVVSMQKTAQGLTGRTA